jgi:hypothetical protein
VACHALAGAVLVLLALSSAPGFAGKGDLVVDPSPKDWVLAGVACGAIWLVLFGIRALTVASHEWIWHFCRAVGAGVVVAASLKIYVLGIFFEHEGYWPVVVASGVVSFAVGTLALVGRRWWIRRVLAGRVSGWTIASEDDAEARIELGLYVASAFFESCCLLVRVGTDEGDAYRSGRSRLAVARVPVRVLRPLVAQWSEMLGGVPRAR